MDMIIISPEPGKVKEIGQKLLALADNPLLDVQWVTWPAPGGYQVSAELFHRFDSDGEDEAAEAAPKRRRGRPRKDTDNNTSEEE